MSMQNIFNAIFVQVEQYFSDFSHLEFTSHHNLHWCDASIIKQNYDDIYSQGNRLL